MRSASDSCEHDRNRGKTNAGSVHVLRIGFRWFRSQHVRLRMQGAQRSGMNAPWEPSAHSAGIPPFSDFVKGRVPGDKHARFIEL